MGLDTTHDCWHGPYSAFMRWRKAIAKAAGLPPLDLMEGFYQSPKSLNESIGLGLSISIAADMLDRYSYSLSPKQPDEDVSMRPGSRLLADFDFPAISWDALRPSPLHILLSHSDCDGNIAAADCSPIADALEALLPKLEADDTPGCRSLSLHATTVRFIAGLRRASEAGEDVEFH